MEKCSRLRVHPRAQKIVRSSVSNVELDRRIERSKFDKIRFAEIPSLRRGMSRESLASQRFQILDRWNSKDASRNIADGPPLEHHAAHLNLRRLPRRIATEDRFFAVVKAMRREVEHIVRRLRQRVIFCPFDQNVQPPFL